MHTMRSSGACFVLPGLQRTPLVPTCRLCGLSEMSHEMEDADCVPMSQVSELPSRMEVVPTVLHLLIPLKHAWDFAERRCLFSVIRHSYKYTAGCSKCAGVSKGRCPTHYLKAGVLVSSTLRISECWHPTLRTHAFKTLTESQKSRAYSLSRVRILCHWCHATAVVILNL